MITIGISLSSTNPTLPSRTAEVQVDDTQYADADGALQVAVDEAHAKLDEAFAPKAKAHERDQGSARI